MGKRQIEDRVQRSAVDFDTFYEQRHPKPGEASGSILVISADSKGVMRPDDLREATRKAVQEETHKLSLHLSRGGKKKRKRKATVAAVLTVAPYVRIPEQITRSAALLHEAAPACPPMDNNRVRASLDKTPEEVLEEAVQEGLHRDHGRKK